MEKPDKHCFSQTIRFNISSSSHVESMRPWYDLMKCHFISVNFLPKHLTPVHSWKKGKVRQTQIKSHSKKKKLTNTQNSQGH